MPLVIQNPVQSNTSAARRCSGKFSGTATSTARTGRSATALSPEDGTEARIRQEPGEPFHGWDDPTLTDFEEVKRTVGVPSASSWVELFATFEEQ